MEIRHNGLAGKRILVTRAKHQARELITRIEELGGQAIFIPLIRIDLPRDLRELDQTIVKLGQFDWMIFTSVNGVSFFFKRLQELNIDLRVFEGIKIVAVGSKTAKALEEMGIQVWLMPQKFRNEEVIAAIESEVRAGEKVLLPRANIAREVLPQELRRIGADVTEVTVYETVFDHTHLPELRRLLQDRLLDVITFTSPSTVQSFISAIEDMDDVHLLKGVKVACIGPVTANAAKELGLFVDAVADEYTIEGLIDTLLKL
jgi:uroporphyrinogen III methyltransferase/synthase